MAVVAQNGLDPSQQQQPNQGGSGTIMGTSGGSAPGSGASSAYQGANASNAPRANPSGAPNIQDYLNANRGAGAKLTSGITQNYQNQANQYQQGLSAQQQNLNTQYNPLNQQVQSGQQYANTAFQNPQALLDAYQQSQVQVQPGQTAPTPNQNDLQNYNNFESTVAGSQQNQQLQQGISNYQQSGQQAQNYLQTQLGQLGQTAALGANAMGQQQLLQQTIGNPNYSTGQQNLDALFLQGNSNQLRQNLNNIYQQASGSTNTAAQDYQSKLNALQQLAGQNQAYTQNLFLNGGQGGTGLNQIAGNVQNEYNTLSQSAPAQQAAIQQGLLTNTLTPQQLQQIGLQSGTQTWGLSGQDIINAAVKNNPLSAYDQGGAAQAATADEFARYSALNQLAGGGTGTLQNSIFGTSTSTGYNPVTVDTQALQNAIDTRKQSVMNDALTAANNTRPTNNILFGGVDASLINQIQSGLNNGSMTPEQANTLVQDTINKYANQEFWNGNGYTNAGDYLRNQMNPWLNYYNTEYSPSSLSELGVTNPGDTNNTLPINNTTGNIDWSQIKAPQGK